jgi:hypothetical protein
LAIALIEGHPLLCLSLIPSYFLKWYPSRVSSEFEPKAAPSATSIWNQDVPVMGDKMPCVEV